ncbi:SusC/RagA family TonB-linked outer membrane protein [Arcicella rigui]|uniref:TonB-dependent receptor n=1 Tax=Arcicella rigui TaxID=797020 RepID=A0ABU5QGI3_9BACT|nr:TonB-dependent receptor [Arcicella rigui]MEA5141657.1 TonB-dependent receptor [Arcicella rigui]
MKKQILFLLGFLLCCSFAKAQKNISGKVSGDDGNPIPGVSVRVKNSQVGVSTDASGSFNLKASADDVLIFSSVGYVSQEIKVGNRSAINVILATNISALEEVVVVGYGTQKRSSVTAAVASVGPKELNALPVPSIEGALQGRVSGVQVTNNGSPGVAPVVRIRGVGSINYAANPLYVVDGYPVGSLNDIDMKDVESLEVLKDASAAAIYGSRAANGVVLITTKKGTKDNKLHVNVETYFATQSPWKKLTPLNTQQYLQYGKALLSAAGAAFPDRWSQMNNETYPGSGVTFANTNTDWQDYLYRTAGVSNSSVNITGGNATSRFLTSFSYFKQDGIYVGTNYERGNLRLNSDHSIGKHFTIGQTLMVSMGSRLDEGVGGGRTALANVIKSLPYTPVYNPTEIGGYFGTTNADGSDPVNPLIPAVLIRSQNRNTRVLSSIFAEIKFTDYLKYKFSVGLDYNNTRSLSRTPIYTAGQMSSPFNSISDTRGEFIGTLYTNQLSFDKTFKKHSVNAIVVAEQQFGTGESITASGNYTTNTFSIITPNVTSPAVGGGKSETTILSYLARVNYDYAGKYLLSASIRRDGSSLFAPGKKWGTFPAASIGWRISEEAFMKDIPAINELKVRASYGLVGNTSGLPNYAWQSLVGAATNYVFANGATPGLSTNQLGNTELGWETTKMADIGLDLGLFKNKITVSADYYSRETSENSLILARPLASSLGYSNNTIANFGGMKNTGLDLQINYNHNAGDFKWRIGGNLGVVRNTVTSLEAPIFAGGHAETGASVTKTEVGMPVQYLYGYVVDKIYQTQAEIDADDALAKSKKWDSYQGGKAAPGDIRFKDLNSDGKIDDADRTMIGNTLPDFTYGVNFDFNYKNFDFTLFLQGVQGNDIYNNLKTQTQGMVRLFGATTDVLNAWTPQNTNTNIPRAISGDPNGNTTRPSDRWVEKGSFMRVKNISLGYNVPSSILKSFARGTLTKVRVYVSAQNLLTITKYSGYDPEIGSRDNAQLVYGIDNGQYPQARTLMAGLQLGF